MTEILPHAAKSPQVVFDDEIFEAHVAGKLRVELKAPLEIHPDVAAKYASAVAAAAAGI